MELLTELHVVCALQKLERFEWDAAWYCRGQRYLVKLIVWIDFLLHLTVVVELLSHIHDLNSNPLPKVTFHWAHSRHPLTLFKWGLEAQRRFGTGLPTEEKLHQLHLTLCRRGRWIQVFPFRFVTFRSNQKFVKPELFLFLGTKNKASRWICLHSVTPFTSLVSRDSGAENFFANLQKRKKNGTVNTSTIFLKSSSILAHFRNALVPSRIRLTSHVFFLL